MDALPFLDDDTFDAVVKIYRTDLEEEKLLMMDSAGGSDFNEFANSLQAVQLQLDELEQQRSLARDARLAQSIVDAKLTDMSVISAIVKQEQQILSDHEYAMKLAYPGGRPSTLKRPDSSSEHSYDQSIYLDSTGSLSKLAGQWVGDKAGRALHPENKDCNPDINFVPSTGLKSECVSCGERKPFYDIATTPCNHNYCRSCITQLFELSFKDESLFPPRCCRTTISMESVDIFLTKNLKNEYETNMIEHNTSDRTYCANKICGAFIKPTDIILRRGRCSKCKKDTCAICKNEAHAADCPQDEANQATLALAEREGWRRCGNCQNMVELGMGCNHITCRCGHHFCYVCGKSPWKTCRCAQWDEANLYERTQAVAARVGGRVNHVQIREQLISRHNCDHLDFRGCEGGDCDECGDNLPIFLYRCTRCRMELCRRCRYNRVR